MRQARSVADAPELVEGLEARGPRPVTVAVESLARMRSPLLEARRFVTPPNGGDGPVVVFPPLREFMGPSAVALVIAAPFLVLAGWQMAIVAGVAATLVRAVERRMPPSCSFASGFLPYRTDDGWPQGLQEDDDVRWNWSSANWGSSPPGSSQAGR